VAHCKLNYCRKVVPAGNDFYRLKVGEDDIADFDFLRDIYQHEFGLSYYTVFVPLTVKSGKDARHFLEKALELGLEPVPHPAHNGSLRKLSLYLPAAMTAQIDAHPNSMARSDLIRGLISAAAVHNGKSAVAGPQVHQSVKWTQHRAQQEMVDTILKGIHAKKITLLEGSTGIGKSRVIARAALKLPSATTIGIFAPTLGVLYQLFEEFLETAKKELKIDPPQSRFTSADAISSILLSLKKFFRYSRPARLRRLLAPKDG
jgi:hypothetical protein